MDDQLQRHSRPRSCKGCFGCFNETLNNAFEPQPRFAFETLRLQMGKLPISTLTNWGCNTFAVWQVVWTYHIYCLLLFADCIYTDLNHLQKSLSFPFMFSCYTHCLMSYSEAAWQVIRKVRPEKFRHHVLSCYCSVETMATFLLITIFSDSI